MQRIPANQNGCISRIEVRAYSLSYFVVVIFSFVVVLLSKLNSLGPFNELSSSVVPFSFSATIKKKFENDCLEICDGSMSFDYISLMFVLYHRVFRQPFNTRTVITVVFLSRFL